MRVEWMALVLACCLLPAGVHGQRGLAPAAGRGLHLPADTARTALSLYRLPSLSALPSGSFREKGSQFPEQEAPPMPSAYSFDELGIFCKWEVQLEKAARLPVKFRLGEVQYVERMEGKLPDY